MIDAVSLVLETDASDKTQSCDGKFLLPNNYSEKAM